jgi:16S rRNA (cytidine1402-2'-O)-methyltransferase
MSGTLFIVATPIGNLEDLSPRARQTLADVDLIAAEDTRRTRRLLSHFGIKTALFALHEHNESRAVRELLDRLADGLSLALVSDAGTPLISDPGFRLVRAAHAAGVRVEPVPGASALTAALSVSGLPTDRFSFEGFLPAKRKARRDRISGLRSEPRTIVFYESVHRLVACLEDLVAGFGPDRPAFIGRELTKIHEQCVVAELGRLQAMLGDGSIPLKGEFVIIVGGCEAGPATSVDIDTLLLELAARLPAREAARIVALVTGEKRNALYRRLLELTGDAG